MRTIGGITLVSSLIAPPMLLQAPQALRSNVTNGNKKTGFSCGCLLRRFREGDMLTRARTVIEMWSDWAI